MAKAGKNLHAPAEIKRNWGWLLGLGVLFIILGCIGLGMTVGLTLVSMWFMGILLFIAGISQIIDTFKSKQWKGVLWHALIAVLYIAAGGTFIYDPFLASVFITAFLAGIFIVIGLTRIAMAITLRHEQGWFWFLLAGLASFILGCMILAQWPWSGLWIIGLLIAIELIINGWTYIFIALALRTAST
jgi:uncharacterized membrane protein HdeD (DUF308 family)